MLAFGIVCLITSGVCGLGLCCLSNMTYKEQQFYIAVGFVSGWLATLIALFK